MLEIIKILLIFPIFFLLLLFPINTFQKGYSKVNFDIHSLNLIINLNILFLFSLFPISIEKYQIIFLLFYIFMFAYKIFKKDFNNLFYNMHIFLIFFASFLMIALSIASKLELGWDAKYFNHTKALFFFEGLSISEIKNFQDYNWHPHFGSYIWAFFWKLPFINIEYFGRLFYAFIFCFSLSTIIFSYIKKNYLSFIIFFTTLILIYNYKIFSGLQEVLIFSLLIISSKYLNESKIGKNDVNVFVLLLIMNILIWIKSEGIIFSITLMFILILNDELSFKKKIFIFLGMVAIISFKKMFYIYLYICLITVLKILSLF